MLADSLLLSPAATARLLRPSLVTSHSSATLVRPSARNSMPLIVWNAPQHAEGARNPVAKPPWWREARSFESSGGNDMSKKPNQSRPKASKLQEQSRRDISGEPQWEASRTEEEGASEGQPMTPSRPGPARRSRKAARGTTKRGTAQSGSAGQSRGRATQTSTGRQRAGGPGTRTRGGAAKGSRKESPGGAIRSSQRGSSTGSRRSASRGASART